MWVVLFERVYGRLESGGDEVRHQIKSRRIVSFDTTEHLDSKKPSEYEFTIFGNMEMNKSGVW